MGETDDDRRIERINAILAELADGSLPATRRQVLERELDALGQIFSASELAIVEMSWNELEQQPPDLAAIYRRRAELDRKFGLPGDYLPWRYLPPRTT